MNIFTLSLFICLKTYESMSGDMISMSCRWQSYDFYSTQEKCEAEGVVQVGHPYYSNESYFNATETIDKSRCIPVSIK
jgi:hypothetical protein